jgi:hypothetical protein
MDRDHDTNHCTSSQGLSHYLELLDMPPCSTKQKKKLSKFRIWHTVLQLFVIVVTYWWLQLPEEMVISPLQLSQALRNRNTNNATEKLEWIIFKMKMWASCVSCNTQSSRKQQRHCLVFCRSLYNTRHKLSIWITLSWPTSSASNVCNRNH